MRRILALLVIFALVAALMVGCQSKQAEPHTDDSAPEPIDSVPPDDDSLEDSSSPEDDTLESEENM